MRDKIGIYHNKIMYVQYNNYGQTLVPVSPYVGGNVGSSGNEISNIRLNMYNLKQ